MSTSNIRAAVTCREGVQSNLEEYEPDQPDETESRSQFIKKSFFQDTRMSPSEAAKCTDMSFFVLLYASRDLRRQRNKSCSLAVLEETCATLGSQDRLSDGKKGPERTALLG